MGGVVNIPIIERPNDLPDDVIVVSNYKKIGDGLAYSVSRVVNGRKRGFSIALDSADTVTPHVITEVNESRESSGNAYVTRAYVTFGTLANPDAEIIVFEIQKFHAGKETDIVQDELYEYVHGVFQKIVQDLWL